MSSSSLSSIPRNLAGATGVIGLVIVAVENLLLLLVGLKGGLSKSMLFHLTSISFSTNVGADPKLPTLLTVSSMSPFSQESDVWYRSRLFRLERGKYETFLR
jgi:hypothetical protein